MAVRVSARVGPRQRGAGERAGAPGHALAPARECRAPPIRRGRARGAPARRARAARRVGREREGGTPRSAPGGEVGGDDRARGGPDDSRSRGSRRRPRPQCRRGCPSSMPRRRAPAAEDESSGRVSAIGCRHREGEPPPNVAARLKLWRCGQGCGAVVVVLLPSRVGAHARSRPSGWDGTNPFSCTLQQAGFGADRARPRRRPVLRRVRQAPPERDRARRRRLPLQRARARRRGGAEVLLLPVRPLARLDRPGRRQHEDLRVGRPLLLRQGARRGRRLGHQLQRHRPDRGPAPDPRVPAGVRAPLRPGHRRRDHPQPRPGRPQLRRARRGPAVYSQAPKREFLPPLLALPQPARPPARTASRSTPRRLLASAHARRGAARGARSTAVREAGPLLRFSGRGEGPSRLVSQCGALLSTPPGWGFRTSRGVAPGPSARKLRRSKAATRTGATRVRGAGGVLFGVRGRRVRFVASTTAALLHARSAGPRASTRARGPADLLYALGGGVLSGSGGSGTGSAAGACSGSAAGSHRRRRSRPPRRG